MTDEELKDFAKGLALMIVVELRKSPETKSKLRFLSSLRKTMKGYKTITFNLLLLAGGFVVAVAEQAQVIDWKSFGFTPLVCVTIGAAVNIILRLNTTTPVFAKVPEKQ